MRRLLLLLALALSMLADEPRVEWRYFTSHNPALPQFSLPAPYQLNGVWVAMRQADPEVQAFVVTLEYQTEQGVRLTESRIVRRWPDAWTNELILVGKVKVLALQVVPLKPAGMRRIEVER